MEWKQADVFTAKGQTGNVYKIYPTQVEGKKKYVATVTSLDDSGNPTSSPIEQPFASIDEAKKACEGAFARVSGKK